MGTSLGVENRAAIWRGKGTFQLDLEKLSIILIMYWIEPEWE